MSNFYPTSIEYLGHLFPTSEHAYDAAKVLDISQREYIASLPTPGQAKRYGHRVDIRYDWDNVKVEIMLDILRYKFRKPYFCQLLIDTGDIPIVENNYWHDNFWGACLCTRCSGDIGENQLGRLLMKVRDEAIVEFYRQLDEERAYDEY
jgi:hypothetical protein